MTSNALTWRAALLALAVVAVWGTNFVVIKVALGEGANPPARAGASSAGGSARPAARC